MMFNMEKILYSYWAHADARRSVRHRTRSGVCGVHKNCNVYRTQYDCSRCMSVCVCGEVGKPYGYECVLPLMLPQIRRNFTALCTCTLSPSIYFVFKVYEGGENQMHVCDVRGRRAPFGVESISQGILVTSSRVSS